MRFVLSLGLLALAFPFITCCPAPEDIYPCTCQADENQAKDIKCSNIDNERVLFKAINGLKGVDNIFIVILSNVVLNYIPHDLFKGLEIGKIWIQDSSITSLSDTDIAFEGLEDVLDAIRLFSCNYLNSWDFAQLKNMRRLKAIDVKGGDLVSIYENVEGVSHLNLEYVNFYDNKISHLSDHVFTNFTKLTGIGLKKNLITEVKRSMFPNPAPNLVHIDLGYNQIMNLPDDVFEDMPSLKTVRLPMNKFLTLKEETFAPVWQQLKVLDLKDNKIQCDCRIKWIAEQDRSPETMNAVCDRPSRLKDQNLVDLDPKELWC